MNWYGLLFAGPRDPRKDLARVTTMADWDFSGYVLDSVRERFRFPAGDGSNR
mgnify:CR=1 FL=1